jgi:AraC-like DNA-binding protein
MNSDDNASIHHNDVRGGLAPWQLKRVNDYEANFGSTIRAADLARIAQQSVSYFSRTFRRSVGYTPPTPTSCANGCGAHRTSC